MKAIILAAGYATRLYPLTLNMPKALLKIGDKPIIDYIVDEICTVDDVNEIIVVTNHKFAKQFIDWAAKHYSKKPIDIIDDGTLTEETRKGAIGDILYVLKQKDINEDIMVIAGDNFFTYKLKDYYDFYKKMDKDCVCVKEFDDRELLKQMGVAVIDENNRIVDIEEKPKDPKSNIAVYATYIYKKETLPMFDKYISEGNKPDAPGYFVEWLYKQKEVYAYSFLGECYDIGTPKSYEEVCKAFGNKED